MRNIRALHKCFWLPIRTSVLSFFVFSLLWMSAIHVAHRSQRAKTLRASNVSNPNQKPNPKNLGPCKPEASSCISDHSSFGWSYKSDWFTGWHCDIWLKLGGSSDRKRWENFKMTTSQKISRLCILMNLGVKQTSLPKADKNKGTGK